MRCAYRSLSTWSADGCRFVFGLGKVPPLPHDATANTANSTISATQATDDTAQAIQRYRTSHRSQHRACDDMRVVGLTGVACGGVCLCGQDEAIGLLKEFYTLGNPRTEHATGASKGGTDAVS